MVGRCCVGLFAAFAVLGISGVYGQVWDPRVAELNQIGGNYELIDVSFDISANILSFSTYGVKYSLSLTLNEDLIIGNVEHMVDGNKNHMDLSNSYFKDYKKSCHYHINSENNDNKYSGSISICPRRGVRGVISIGGDTLIITPAKRLLDLEYDSHPDKHHDVSDKHLIYLMSNFDNTGFENAIKMEEDRKKENHNSINEQRETIDMLTSKTNKVDILAKKMGITEENIINNNNRKLLATNYCEFLAMADPWWYQTFYSNYGSNYYDNLVSEISDVVNYMSGKFSQTNWGSSVGTIYVRFVAILVMKSFSGDYASLEPSQSGGSTSSSSYLSKLVSWSASYKPSGSSSTYSSKYDAIQIFVGADNFDTGGLAYVGTVCNNGGYNTGLTGIRNGNYMYPTDTIGHIATHELGHNFKCSHDQDTTCGNEGGLMGYGSNHDVFSVCSIGFVNQLFSSFSNCMQDGVQDFEDDPDESGDGGNTGDDDDDDDDDDDGGSGSDCIRVYNIGTVNGYNFDTVYSYGGSYNSQSYYQATISGKTFYMYYSGNWNGYHIYDSFAWSSGYVWSSGTDPTSSSSWYTNENGWSYDDDAYATSECSGGGNSGDDDDDDDGGSSCGEYNCVGVWNFDLSQYNGQYSYAGYCHNGKAVYYQNGYYLYYNSYWNYWGLYTSVKDEWIETACLETNVMDCSSNWYVYSNGWYVDTNSYMYTCSGYDTGRDGDTSEDGTIIGTDFTLSDDCTNDYGDNVCIYNDGTLWEDGIATFSYRGCYNSVPFFHYTSYPSNNNDSIINYYLHYDKSNNLWEISKSSAESLDSVASCNQTDLTLCTYKEWTVQVNMGDSIMFELSDSMGYDSVCVSQDDGSLAYCQTDGSCALWQFKILINDPTFDIKACDSNVVQCLDGNFVSNYIKDINSVYMCESDSEMYIYYNISFISTQGYDIYNDYTNNFIGDVENCYGNPQETSGLDIKMIYSNLKTCDNCQNFIPGNDDEDEESNATKLYSGGALLSMVFGLVLVALF